MPGIAWSGGSNDPICGSAGSSDLGSGRVGYLQGGRASGSCLEERWVGHSLLGKMIVFDVVNDHGTRATGVYIWMIKQPV